MWTVNGVKFDADAQAAAAKVNAATNQVELLTALKSTYFTGVVDANIAAYKTEIDGNKPYATVADIQKAIDKVNKAGVTGELISDIKDAMDDNNEVALLTLLGDASFERVNADFITQYMAAFKAATPITTSSTVANVQAKIDGVNLAEATAAVTAADTTAATALKADSIAKAQELVSALPEKEVAEKTAKKSLQDKIDVANAFAKVKGATTQASLLSALKAPVLKLQNIDDALAKYYKAEFDKPTGKDAITSVAYTLQNTIVDVGKTAAITDLGDKISKVDDDTKTADLKALLVELKRLDGTNLTADIIDALLEDYRDALVAKTTVTDKDETSEIQTIIAAVNNPATALTTLADSGGVLTDADKLLLALKAKTLNLKNVKDDNKTAYFADLAAIKTAARTSAADVQKVINTVNFVVDANAATTAGQMQAALTGIAVNESEASYIKLSSAAKTEVAELVLAARNDLAGKKFANKAAVKAQIVTTTGTYTGFFTNVNAAGDIEAMMTALDNVSFPAYQELDTIDKVEQAEIVYNELLRLKALDPAQKFETVSQIQAAIDTAIAAQ